MKALSDSFARYNISGLCLIAALSAGCTFDASQLRALPDGAVEPSAAPDAGAAGSGDDTANPADAPTATGGSGGSTDAGGAGDMDVTSGAGGIGGIGGSTGLGGSGGIGDHGDSGVLDALVAQPDVPISGSGGDAGGTGGVGGGGVDAGGPDAPVTQPDVPIGGSGGGTGGTGGVGGGGSSGSDATSSGDDAGVADAPGTQPDVLIGGTGGGFGTGGSGGVDAGGSSGTGGGPGAGGTTNLGGTVTGGSATGGTSQGTGGTGAGGTGTGGAIAPMIISIDFVGGKPPYGTGTVVMAATESAGVKSATHWNTAAGNTGTRSSLVLADGTNTSASATWNSPLASPAQGTWSLAWTDSPGDVRMMNGYLDPGATATPATINVTGLASPMSSGYDVYVYCFGDMPWVETRTYQYTIGSTTHTVTQAQPPMVTSFSGYTLAPEAGAGNYVVFRNVTGTSFTLTATPASSTRGLPYMRAPVNGIQIVSPSGS